VRSGTTVSNYRCNLFFFLLGAIDSNVASRTVSCQMRHLTKAEMAQ
jgi:hypothetical protein